MLLSISPISVCSSFNGNNKFVREEKPVKDGVAPSTAAIGTLAAMAITGFAVYCAMKGKISSAVDTGKQLATNTKQLEKLEKLPSRQEVLESLGIRLNDRKLLVVGVGKNQQLYDGKYSYTVKNRNITEFIEEGKVKRRIISTEATKDSQVTKFYNYYSSDDSLHSITTKKGDEINTVLRNQTALKEFRAALKYTPKTPEQIKALEGQGIKYEVIKETVDYTDKGYGTRELVKEVYTYPESSNIITKEVRYGADKNVMYGGFDLDEGKKIILTFRKPVKANNPDYKADRFVFSASRYGFSYNGLIGDIIGPVRVESPQPYLTNAIPLQDKVVVQAIEAEFPNSLRKIYPD